ncbi:MAG: NrfD/PsrC family molybdoenzyme membrane anchor subunit [Candidatus Limnocylindria bacterium]
MIDHFAHAPNWEWWILGYFFFAGIAGGSYVVGSMLRWWGGTRDQSASRLAFIVSFLALVPCPVFLIIDLGRPLLFWHMLIDAGSGSPIFKFWAPMSLGSWALLLFGLYSFVSFLGALGASGRAGNGITGAAAGWLRGAAGSVWSVIGTVLGLFVAGYTGVLLTVSSQPVWSDGWALGGLFLASALSASTALLLLVVRRRAATADEANTGPALSEADRWFVIMEAVLLAIFFVTVATAGWLSRTLGGWILLWLVVIVGIAAPFVAHPGRSRWLTPQLAAVLTIVGTLALRAVVIFSPQI